VNLDNLVRLVILGLSAIQDHLVSRVMLEKQAERVILDLKAILDPAVKTVPREKVEVMDHRDLLETKGLLVRLGTEVCQVFRVPLVVLDNVGLEALLARLVFKERMAKRVQWVVPDIKENKANQVNKVLLDPKVQAENRDHLVLEADLVTKDLKGNRVTLELPETLAYQVHQGLWVPLV